MFITNVTAAASRGSTLLKVANTTNLDAGQYIRIVMVSWTMLKQGGGVGSVPPSLVASYMSSLMSSLHEFPTSVPYMSYMSYMSSLMSCLHDLHESYEFPT